MRWFNASNYLDSLRPVYLATKICHIHFETINFEQQTASRKLQDQFRFVLTLLLDLYLLYNSFKFGNSVLAVTDSVLINVGWYCTIIAYCLFAALLPLWNRYKSREMFEIFENILHCDRELLKLGVSVNHRKHHVISTVYVGTIMFIMAFFTTGMTLVRFTDCCKYYHDLMADDLMILVSVRIMTNINMFICYTSLILVSIRERFVKLQESIRRYHHMSMQPGSINSEQTCVTIRKFAEVYDQLSDTVKLFNCCYSGDMAYVLAVAFAFIIFAVFGLIHSLASSANQVTVFMSWSMLFYAAFYFQMIVQLILFSSRVYRESERTTVEIHKASHDACNKRVLKELRCFSQQILHQVPKISCSFFDIDWILLYTMAGSFTTYLVILLQFDFVNFT